MKIDELRDHGRRAVKIIFTDGLNVGGFLRDTLSADKLRPEEAIIEIYRRMRPGDPPTVEAAKQLFDNLFFNPDRYDLSRVGRLKLNYKFTDRGVSRQPILTKNDILATLRYLIELKNGRGTIEISITSVTAAFAP